MKKYYCDKCGKEMHSTNMEIRSGQYKLNVRNIEDTCKRDGMDDMVYTTYQRYVLCETCLFDFLKRLVDKKEHEDMEGEVIYDR